MKKYLSGSLILYFLIGFLAPDSFSQIWSENFNSYPDGTVNAAPTWTSVATDCDDAGNLNLGPGNSQWGVWTGQFTVNDIEGAPCCPSGGGNDNYWLSGSIALTGYCNVNISLNVTFLGVFECSPGGPLFGCTGNVAIDNGHDQVVAYYSLDGGPFVQFAYVCGTTGIGVLSVAGLNGTTLQIKVSLANKANAETYYFDDVVVNGTPFTTPAISGIPATICQSAASIALPTTQSGITGNWSGTGVAANNFNPSGLSGSITLTFTPNAGQCSNSNTTSITVNVPITPAISGIPATICQNATAIALPTTQSGITGNWSGMGVAGNNFNPSGLSGNITLTFTPGIGQCGNNNTTTINVTIPVTPTISGIPATICQTAASISLPTTQSGINGNWSGTGVAGNNFDPAGLSGSITLTFTPNAGQCANATTTTIDVNLPTTPIISGIPLTLCQNDSPVALPTTQSGITGTWSGTGVAGNNFNPAGLSGNITLTFTPNVGQCAIATTTTIDVNLPSTPVISGIPATICQSDSPIALPTTQSSITGMWSGTGVSGNNFNPAGLSGNITLTFTPNAGQCAIVTTTTIDVNVPVDPVISGIPSSLCQSDSPVSLPTSQSGITGTWSGMGVTGNNFNPAGLSGNVTLTFTPIAGQCANIVTTSIDVTLPVTPVISGIPASICQNDSPISLPVMQGSITGNWSGMGVTGNNFNPAGLSGNITLTFTPNAGQCANLATTIISVSLPTTPVISGIPATICQNNNSISLPTTQSGFTGNWSGMGVAGNNFNPAGLSGNITLTFTPNAGQCANIATTNITVNLPVTPVISGIPATICQTASSIALPTTQSGITGNWSGTGVTGNNFNPAGLNGVILLTFTPTVGQCANVATTNITVNTPTTPIISGIPSGICNNAAPISLPTTQSGIVGTWSGQGVTGNNFNPMGLSGSITLTFTPNSGQCAILTTTSISINSAPTFTNLTEDCNLVTQTYTVTFTITGGNPGTYTVNGQPVVGSTFTSTPIPSGTGYVFNLNDGNGCGPVVISGLVDCNCATSSGTMDFTNTPLQICDGSGFAVTHDGNATLDIDDVLEFILHTNPGATLGTVIAISNSENFVYPGGIVQGQVYYVSAVAGNNNGSGGVNLNDPCLSVSQGVPVIFYLPAVVISAGGSICGNECFDFQVQFSGFPPYNLDYSINAGGNIFNFNLTSNTNTSAINVCPSDFGISSGQIQIFATSLADDNCTVDFNIPVIQTLTVLPNAVNDMALSLCPGGSIVVNGTVYNQANPIGMEVLQNAGSNGCDSTIFVSLSFYNPAINNLNQTLCTGGSITVNGVVYDAGHPMGTEILPNGSSHGCDSTINVNLTFNSFVTFNLNQTLCPGGSIVVNGTTYDAAHPSGSETFIGGSYLGCDSVVNINLSFYSPAVSNLNQTLCTGGSITVNGTVYDASHPTGTEIIPNASIHGCDSTINVNLSFNNVVTHDINSTLCFGGSIVVNGTTYNAANPTGSETFIGGSYLGCDSVVNVNLSFYPQVIYDLMQSLCTGDFIVVNGTVYDEGNPSGTEILQNADIHGCDSTVNVNLTFNTASNFNLNQTLCPGGSITVNGTLYDAAHPTGTEIFIGGNYLGCDSVVNISLSFYAPAVYDLTQTLCIGGSIIVNGTVYDESHPNGTEILPNASSHGCDSTVNVSLSFNTVIVYNLNQTLCTGDSIVVNGTTYNEANPTGSETFVGGSFLGCDSMVNINLAFYPPVILLIDSTLLPGDSLVVNGHVYNEMNPSGVEVIVGGSYTGCDSSIFITLTFSETFTVNVSVEPPCSDGRKAVVSVEEPVGGIAPFTISLSPGMPAVATFPENFIGWDAGFHLLTIVDAAGVTYEEIISIPDTIILSLDLGSDQTILFGASVMLSPQTNFTVITWLWTPPDFLDCTDCEKPTAVMPTNDITYMLVAYDTNGCSVTDDISIFVPQDHEIFMPTSFSPNGDGANDVITIFGGPQIFRINSLQIFNRWGSLLFKAEDFLPNDLTAGWDGTFREEKMDIGVYAWLAEVEFQDGTTAIFKGDLTLLR